MIKTTYRDGPKGGPGGEFINEPEHEPHRLEGFKVNHGNCIVSFQFSYVDKDGNKRTEGPWGGSRVWKFDEVRNYLFCRMHNSIMRHYHNSTLLYKLYRIRSLHGIEIQVSM